MINKFCILNGAKYFYLGIFQNYLVVLSTKKYIKYFSGTTRINSWKSDKMSEENIENITKSDSFFAQTFVDHQYLLQLNEIDVLELVILLMTYLIKYEFQIKENI